MRLFIASRSRFAEDALADAIQTGTSQAIILGAGLDTLAYRNPHPGMSVFEVDHPDTQPWKRRRLAAAGIDIPASDTTCRWTSNTTVSAQRRPTALPLPGPPSTDVDDGSAPRTSPRPRRINALGPQRRGRSGCRTFSCLPNSTRQWT